MKGEMAGCGQAWTGRTWRCGAPRRKFFLLMHGEAVRGKDEMQGTDGREVRKVKWRGVDRRGQGARGDTARHDGNFFC